MSRYQNNGAQIIAKWAELIDLVEEKLDGNETIPSNCSSDVSRLVKVIHFMDGQVRSIDEDLMPLNHLGAHNMYGVIQDCIGHINAFLSSNDIGHINGANERMDTVINILRPFILHLDQNALTAFKRASTTYANQVEKDVASFKKESSDLLIRMEESKTDFEGKVAELENSIARIKSFDADLHKEEGSDKGIKILIEESHGKISLMYNEILKFNDQLLGEGNPTPSISGSISETKAVIEKNKKHAESLLAELTGFYVKCLGKENEQGDLVGGIKQELEQLIDKLRDFEVTQKKRYEELNTQIKSLLPRATSAGLASAYGEMKESFNDIIEKSDKLFRASISAMIGVFVLSFSFLAGPFDELLDIVELTLLKLSIYVPLGSLAYYASKRRSEANRLQQEYAHKEAMAKSYESYKQQIDNLQKESNGLLADLLQKTIDAVAYNPSETLEKKHGDATLADSIADAIAKANKSK